MKDSDSSQDRSQDSELIVGPVPNPVVPGAGNAPGFRHLLAITSQLYHFAALAAWRSRLRIALVTAVLAAALLIVIQYVDPGAMRWLDTWRSAKVAELASFLSFIGEFQMLPLALVVGIWIGCEKLRRPDGRIAMAAAGIAMMLGGITVQLPKFIFGRPRPHFNLPDQFAWFHPDWNSFPSGHATHWFALVGALWAFSPRISMLVAPIAVIVSSARVLARAHYPSDVMAGAAFGLFFGLCFGLAARSINANLKRLKQV